MDHVVPLHTLTCTEAAKSNELMQTQLRVTVPLIRNDLIFCVLEMI